MTAYKKTRENAETNLVTSREHLWHCKDDKLQRIKIRKYILQVTFLYDCNFCSVHYTTKEQYVVYSHKTAEGLQYVFQVFQVGKFRLRP